MRTRLEILHVHSGNLFGGVERVLETLAGTEAINGGLASSFALCFDGRLSETLRREKGMVFLLGAVSARNIVSVWRARRALESVLTSRRFDAAVVHSAWAQAIFGPILVKVGLPLARWIHAPGPGPVWLETWAARTPPALAIYNSRYTHDAARRMPGAREAVIYPPVPPPGLPPRTRDAVRAALGTPSDRVVIVMASRLEAWKGHALLLEALGQLRALPIECWIAGGAQRSSEERYLESMRHAARESGLDGTIRWLGEQDDVASLLNAADVHCQPNAGPEPFGITFVEALAAGLPVVTTRLGAAPEIVDDSCGVLTPPHDARDLAAALSRLVSDDAARRRLAAGARRRAAVFCDVRRTVAALAGVFETVVAPAGVLS